MSIGKDGRVSEEQPSKKTGQYEVYSRIFHKSEWFGNEGDARKRAKAISQQHPMDTVSVIVHASITDLLVSYEAGNIKPERW